MLGTMDVNLKPIPRVWWRLLYSGVVIFSLASLFYVEENWRGKRDWEKCQQEANIHGRTLDWNAYIPPPIADSQNFFKAPKMARWFIKPKATNAVNELAALLTNTNSQRVLLANVEWHRVSAYDIPTTNQADLTLRYSEQGTAVFLPSADSSTNISPDTLIPIIKMYDVPLLVVIENLAKVGNIKYQVDPKIAYNRPDASGQIKPEPTVTVHWEKISARQALLAVLNQFDLQLKEDSSNGAGRITFKDPIAGQIYSSPGAEEKTTALLENILGKILISPLGETLLTKPSHQIKPATIIVESENPLSKKDLTALFTRFYPSRSFQGAGAPGLHVEETGTSSYTIFTDAVNANDYLKWSDQFEPEFDAMRAALKRPYARMEGNYSQSFYVPTPDYRAMRSISQMLAERAQCNLLIEKPDRALQQLELLDDLRQVLEAKPSGKLMTLVSAMINAALAGLYVGTVADGLDLHAWQKPQLVTLQDRLKAIELPPFLVEALKAEPTGICHWAESNWIPKNYSLSVSFFHLRVPVGWAYQNMVNVAQLSHKALNGFGINNDYISPSECKKASHEIDELLKNDTVMNHLTIGLKYLAVVALPNYMKAEETTAHNQTMVNEAQIACALERYRLVHNVYPDSLETLRPKFIGYIPRDIIGGDALKYRRLKNGQFLLYSVGWDETDDKGQALPNNITNYEKGDWVWPGQ